MTTTTSATTPTDKFAAVEQMSLAKVARQKIGAVPENFRICATEVMDDEPHRDSMKVTGAEFSPYTQGPKKGQLGDRIPGTDREVIVSKLEIQAQERLDQAGAA